MVGKNNLPRSLSLKSQVEIKRLLKQGKRISGENFTVVWEVSDSFKYGIFLSRKHGKAVSRNRLKRLFREAIRLNRSHLVKAVRLAVLPDTAFQQPKFERINAEISRIFKLIQARGR